MASPRSHHVLGRIEELQSFIAHDPGVVHTRGGDGQTPLHFASSVAVAQILLAAGADINALDVDHESTPAQYMLRVEQGRHYPRDRQSVARYLIQKGCNTDLLMAALAGNDRENIGGRQCQTLHFNLRAPAVGGQPADRCARHLSRLYRPGGTVSLSRQY